MKTYQQIKDHQAETRRDIEQLIARLAVVCENLSQWRNDGAWSSLSVQLKHVEGIYLQLSIESNIYHTLCWMLNEENNLNLPLSMRDIEKAENVIVDKKLIKTRKALLTHSMDINRFIFRTDYIRVPSFDEGVGDTIVYGEPVTLKELLVQLNGG